MRLLGMFILFFCLNDLFAQDSFHFIYVDISAQDSNMNLLSKKMENQILKINGSMIFFLSIDNHPIITNDKNKAIETLKDLNYIKSFYKPSKPDFFDEIDTINSILTNIPIFYGIEKIDDSQVINNPVNFIFCFSSEQANLYDQVGSFIDKLLITNRILANKHLNHNCSVSVYFDRSLNTSKDYINQVKNNKLYDVYEY